MKALDKALLLLFALVLAVGISACQKQNETDLSSTGTENQASTNPSTDQMTPPVQETPPPAVEPAPVTPTKSAPTHASSATHTPKTSPKSSKAVNAAETRTVSLPSGSSFDIELTTPINSGKNKVGDPVEGKLLQPLTADGMVIAEQGAVI